MQRGSARFLMDNRDALRVVASSARISTQEGNAIKLYEAGADPEKNLKLAKKVLSSGHKSVIEHQNISIAFNDVSVLVEQFVIEFRLASFTVKSRRYVDFSDAGYVVPDGLGDELRRLYEERCHKLFDAYRRLLEMGIPKEDARFVLPYGFRSNFYMTINARELIHMIAAMLVGRGSRFAEIKRLGMQMKEQFDALYPGIIDTELAHRAKEEVEKQPSAIAEPSIVAPSVTIIDEPKDPMHLLESALAFSRRFENTDAQALRALINDARPRELELLQYCFRIDGISLACITHFTRHRMLSLLLQHEYAALAQGKFILPESIKANAAAAQLYRFAFEDQSLAARHAQELGAGEAVLSYFAMAGHASSIVLGMNARELLHFAKLRSCSRAQWEIRSVARSMLEALSNTASKALFENYGPTCAVTGHCPEGKMTCGHPVRIVNGQWTVI